MSALIFPGYTAAQLSYDRREPQSRWHSEADRQAHIDKLAKEMILPGGECDPLDSQNLAEALSEACAGTAPEIVKLAGLLRKHDDIAAGNKLREISVSYWTKYATRKAKQDVADEDNYPCCGGRGCARCERNEF